MRHRWHRFMVMLSLGCVWGQALAPGRRALAASGDDSSASRHLQPEPGESWGLADPPGPAFESMLEQLWLDAWGLPFLAGQSHMLLEQQGPEYAVQVRHSAGPGGMGPQEPEAQGTFEVLSILALDELDLGGRLAVLHVVAGTLYGNVPATPGISGGQVEGIPMLAVVIELQIQEALPPLRLLGPLELTATVQEAAVLAEQYLELSVEAPQPGMPGACTQALQVDTQTCHGVSQACALHCALLTPMPSALAACMVMCAVELALCLGAAWYHYGRCLAGWEPFKAGPGG